MTNLTFPFTGRCIQKLLPVLLAGLFSIQLAAQPACDPAAEFNYDAAAYCQNGADPVVSHSTGADGSYTFAVVSGGPTLSLNPSTGDVDLSASDPGIYEVTNTVSTGGGNGPMLIAGVVDGPLSGGTPKAIEFYVGVAISDLSEYGFGSANNGGGSDGQEFTFPAIAVPAGTRIWVASETTNFNAYFGFNPDYTSSAAAINGDDAIELFHNGAVIDVFGDINQDGTGTPWDYQDGWAYRVNNTGPDGNTFVLANWTFSGPNALDGTSTNATAPNPWPIGSYTSGATASCTQTIEIVAPPTADAGPNQVICAGNAALLGASGAGTWSGGDGTFSDVNDPAATYTPAATEAGSVVTLTWTVAAPGAGVCTSAIDEVNITVLEAPDAEFSYDASEYCPNAPNAVVSHTTGTDGVYTFMVLSGGPSLALNSQTGAIDISASDKGTYEVTNTVGGCGNLIITGLIDGPVTGGLPKAIEFYALADIPDLSIYGFGSANNGGGSDGEEFSFPADAVAAGTYIWVATEASVFEGFFGFPPTYTDNLAPSINGDDAIELFCNGMVIDVFGDINQDGSGTPWEYRDGWAYRVADTGPDGSFFELSHWTFSGPDALDGFNTNAAANNPFPIGTFSSSSNGICADDQHTVTITIDDAEAPVLDCPQDMIITLGPGLCSKIVNFFVTATDNCDPAPVIEQTAGDVGSGEHFYIGVHSLEYTATDAEGNQSACTFTVTIKEYPNPVSTLSCNDNVQASLDANGQALIGADMVLEGGPYGCYDDYQVEVLDENGESLGNLLTCENIGYSYTVRVTDPDTGNKCWGQVKVEDKMPPTIDCFDRTIACSQDVAQVPPPAAVDNCDVAPAVQLLELVLLDNNACDDDTVSYRRTWIAFDDYENESLPCSEIIYVVRPKNVNFPNDIAWHCEQYAAYPNITNATSLHSGVTDTDPSDYDIDVSASLSPLILQVTGSGIPEGLDGEYCMYGYVYADEILEICGGSPGVFKIKRTWTVLDWCTSSVITAGFDDENGNGVQDPGEENEDNIQIIKIADYLPPVITVADVTVNANVQAGHPDICRSTLAMPLPVVTDNCSGVADVKILTPIGEAVNGVIPEPGLPLGTHTITVSAGDACANYATTTFTLTVVDGIAPVAVCDEITDVNLSSDGLAEVFAETFDDGSHDNCCLSHFEVRKMDDYCDDGHDDTVFGPSVVFCCEDVVNNPVTVIFRAYDCFDNYNDCMVQVNVNDKQKPLLLTCPGPERVSCDFYAEQIETQLLGLSTEEQSLFLDQYFGAPTFSDNCFYDVNRNVSLNIDQCLEGSITRSWQAEDPAGNTSSSCSQTVFVDHVSDWVIEFPADITLECGSSVPDFGEPEIFFESCELVAVSYNDEVFNTVPDACFKILRTWTVINWCVVGDAIDDEVIEQPESQLGLPFPACDLDGDGDCDNRTFRDSWNSDAQPTASLAAQSTDPDTDPDSDPWDGYITYQQTIKVIDTVDPVFAFDCVIPDVVFTSTDCTASFELPEPPVEECSGVVSFEVESDLGSGFGPFIGVAPGVYNVTYKAIDNCNNQAICETTVTVKDGKKPTPYCKTGIVTELMDTDPPMVQVWAADLDEGSFDNCSTQLTYSFSQDLNDQSYTFTCDHIGTIVVNMWVTDDAGNQDYCQVFVVIQDNQGLCSGTPLVTLGGNISNEEDTPVKDVSVKLSGTNSSAVMTGADGSFEFTGIEQGGDYTVVPAKSENPLNGVSTFDLVLITKHILGTQPLDSPYKIIAADANKSGSVTTYDLVELRKLILFVYDELPLNSSWRFVDRSFVFPNPENPFETSFPEIYNVNNLPADKLDADFVAIKVGDVNLSAVPNFNGGPEERSFHGQWGLRTDNLQFHAGELLEIPVRLADAAVEGFQFTLDFDIRKLEFAEVRSNVISKENFGFRFTDKGALTVSWNQSAPTDGLSESVSLFTLVFRAIAAGELSQALRVNSRLTAAEAYKQDGSLVKPVLLFDQSMEQVLALSNSPNPFTQSTTISFTLPEAGQARLSISDLSGKQVLVIERTFAKGMNQVRIGNNQLPSTGVYFYTLTAGNYSATRKMVLIE